MKTTKKIQMVINDLRDIKRCVKDAEKELKQLKWSSHKTDETMQNM